MKEKIMNVLRAIIGFFPGLFKAFFGSKSEKIRNKNLFKRGGYAIAVIALVIIGAIVLNVLMGLLSERVDLTYDLTSEKKNSISKENEEYLKKLEKDVEIYMFATSASEYYGGMMQYMAENAGYNAETNEYYTQTPRLLEAYDKISDHITVTYIDPYGTEVAEFTNKYAGETFGYGDILVTSNFKTEDGAQHDNYKILSFFDIYNYVVDEEASQLAAMGMGSYSYIVNGSRLETSLTSAIANVTSEETKKVGLLASHSNKDAFSYYKNLLELNNFIVEDIEDQVVLSIDNSFDIIMLYGPTADFTKEEVEALSVFLENGGNLGKSFIFYGDSSNQSLPNLYSFLEEWGIVVEPGIVMETDSNFIFKSNDYSSFVSVSQTSESEIVEGGTYYPTGYNIPMRVSDTIYLGRETEALLATNGTSVVVPVGTDSSVLPQGVKRKFATCILSSEEEYVNNIAVGSYVLAFSSIDFITEDFAVNYAGFNFKDLALKGPRFVTGMGEAKIIFDDKTIDATNQLYVVSKAEVAAMKWMLIGIIPVCILAAAFVVFFIRRNK